MLDALERARLLEALEKAHWNVSVAAEALRMPRNTLRYRMERHDLARPHEPVPRRRSTATPDSPPAPTERTGPLQPLRWETRTATWLRATVVAPSVSEVDRLLAVFAGKVAAFGGEVVQQTPTSLDAAFGLEASEDAPARAANAALAIQKAASRSAAPGSEPPAVTLALHTSRCSVGLGQARPWLAPECLREAGEALAKLLIEASPGDVALSPAVAPLLARRFEVRSGGRGP
jgi:hypothetical protein